MNFINWANANQGFSQLVASAVTLLVTVIYIVFVKRQADEAKRQADLILSQNLYETHQELVKEVYGPIIDWLERLREEFILERYIFDFNGPTVTWEEYKKKLSPLVYRLPQSYISHISQINNLFKNFRSNFGDSVQTMRTITEEAVVRKLNIEYTLKDVRVFSPADELWHDLSRTVFSEEYLTNILSKVNEKGEVALQLSTENANVQMLNSPAYEFSEMVLEIRNKMLQDINLSSKIAMYNKIRTESQLLLNNIEKEARKTETDLVREING